MSATVTKENTGRFTGRTEAYAKHRPSFPSSVPTEIFTHLTADSGATILDVGSGTAIVSDLILQNLKQAGKTSIKVIGLEPNAEMRAAGDDYMKAAGASGDEFRSISATGEHTELPDKSVDVVTMASTFHWLDGPKTRAECLRILKDPNAGGVAIMENQTRPVETIEEPNLRAFMTGYKEIREKFESGQTNKQHEATMNETAMNAFFGPKGYTTKRFAVPWSMKWETFKGVMHSDSTTPNPDNEKYGAFYGEMEALFNKWEKDGRMDFVYDAVLYYGHISS
ncbi:MAG: hypothetical protein M1828_007567 [Chrysothrix sp. TS-e1954]|nr:MAG: hypothetical protein M1828_007567 [Chrysothrix sp. TS-e1954]